MINSPKINRINELNYRELTDEQATIYDAIASGPRKGVRGPLAVWLHRPALAQRAQSLGAYCRYDSSLPQRLSELAILVLAVEWQAEYEWVAHKPHAIAAGLDENVLQKLKTGLEPEFQAADEHLVYQFVRSLIRDKTVDSDLYHATTRALGSETVVDLVGIIGYYTLVSMTIKTFDIAPVE